MNFKFDIKRFFPSKTASDADVINTSLDGKKDKFKNIAVFAKSNWLVLTLALVSISVFLGAFLFSDSLQKKNEEEAQKFGERMVALSKLEQTSVKIAIPGNLEINEKMLVTKNLVNAVRVKMPTRDLKEENSKQSMESMAIDL